MMARKSPQARGPGSGKIQRSRVAAKIDRLLRELEACRSAGLSLPAEQVAKAATLIRLYAQPPDASADSWLDREHARSAANLLNNNQRLLGSRPLQRPKPRLFPTASELLAELLPEPRPELEPEPAVTLYDLIETCKSLMQYCKEKKAARKR
jgi:hypothetical protein